MANIDNLNFGVILNDDDFNRKIEEDIEAAKRFNVQLSSLLDAKAKMPQFKVSVRTKEAEESLEKLNAKFAELEAADWTKVGKKLDVTHQVEQALIQLRNLEEEIEVIQEIRQEKGGDMGLALELKNAQEQADRLIASIAALREAEKAVNAPSQFQSHIRSLTEQSMEYKQLVEYMKAEEAAAAEVAKEKAKEEAARQKNTKAIEKERAAMAKGEFKEYIESLTAANPTLKQMSTYYKQLEKETAKNANAAKGAAVHQKRLNDQFKVTSRLGREVKNALIGIFSVHEASKLVSSLVRVTGEFELQKTTLAAMLGDLNKAEQIITRIQGLAVESPFQFKELTTYAKQLSAFSVPAEELYETTKMLADVSAGLGVGMDRIVLAYGQVRSAAFLRGQEVRQFTEAGIPILDELAKQFTELEGRAVSTGEVFDKISARLVPFEMVAKVFKDMTSEGGKFYNMQEVQAETLRGKLSNLKDAYEMMLNEIGSAHSDKLKGAVDGLRSLMQNWEAIGSQLVFVIKMFGAYKAAAGLLNISDTIAKFGGLTKALKQTAIAQKLLNSALITNPYVAVGTAILAIVMSLRNAAKASREFKEEIDKIAATQYGEADKAADRYNKLTQELQNATKGSHNYREAISKINNEYGEYLPQLLDEKNALDLIKTSSDAVTASIYNRARARAYERSQQKTEDMYGESRDYYMSTFLQKLQDDGISEKAARELFANFTEAVKKQADGWDPADVFNQVYRAYFSTSENYFTEVGNALNDLKQSTPFIRNIYGANTTGWMTARDALWNYALVQNKVLEAEKEYNDILESRWGNGAKSDAESRRLSQIASWYDKQTAAINAAAISEQERIERLKNLDISKLQLLVQLYEELDKDPNTARTDLLEKYKDELNALTKQLDGWQKKVADALNPYGIKGKGAGDYGLFADQSTSYLEYVNNLRNSYKGLAQQIADTAKANPKLNAELKKQKEIIEAVAKALNIDLILLSNAAESNEEKRIKRLIDALRKLQDQYEKLKALGVSDSSIQTLFKSLFPDMAEANGEEFVTSLNYLEEAKKYVEELRKYNPEEAERLSLSLNADESSDYISRLQAVINATKKYYDSMRKWASEDFNIDGKGIAFDISKIVSDLQSGINEIDLNAKKMQEMFSGIDLKDENILLGVKDVFEKEFGEGSWDVFFNEFLSKGTKAIETLAGKQETYEKRIAQDKINNLAKSYFGDMTDGLNLSDWGDKSIAQIEQIRQRLINLRDTDIELPASLVENLTKLGLSTEDLQAKIRELFGEEIQNVTIEKFKALSDIIGEVTSMASSLGDQLIELGDTMGSDFLKGFGKSLKYLNELTDILTECESLMMAFAKSASKVGEEVSEIAGEVSNVAEGEKEAAENAKEVAEGIGDAAKKGEDLAKSSDWITLVLKLAVFLISKVIEGINGSQKALHEARMAAIEYSNAINQIEYDSLMASFDSYFGTDEYGKAIQAMRDVQKYQESILENQKKIGVSQKDLVDFQMDSSGWATFSKGLQDAWKDIKNLGEGDILADARTGWQKFWGTGNDLIKTFNISDFMDAEGMLDGEKLRKFYETYGDDISDSNKEAIEEILGQYDLYVQSMEALTSYMSDMFGNVADDMADSFIESFKESGQAALEYGDIMNDVATNIAKSIIKSVLLQHVFTEEMGKEAAAMLASGDVEGVMTMFEEVMQSAQALTPYFQEFLEGVEPYFEMGEGTTDMGEGIKGITEDTASLLASYINAMRADLSMMKGIQAKYLPAIGESIPTIMDYLAQIQANTYNTAMSSASLLDETRAILGELRGVITTDSGDTAIRVYS